MVHMCRRSSVTRSTTLTAPGTPTAEHATLPPLGYKSSPNRSKGGYEMSAQRRGGVGGNVHSCVQPPSVWCAGLRQTCASKCQAF